MGLTIKKRKKERQVVSNDLLYDFYEFLGSVDGFVDS